MLPKIFKTFAAGSDSDIQNVLDTATDLHGSLGPKIQGEFLIRFQFCAHDYILACIYIYIYIIP